MTLKSAPRGLWDRGGAPSTPLRVANRLVSDNSDLSDGTGGGEYRSFVHQIVPVSWAQLQGSASSGTSVPANQDRASSLLAPTRIDDMLAYLRDNTVPADEQAIRAQVRIMVRIVAGTHFRTPKWVRFNAGSFDMRDIPGIEGTGTPCPDHGVNNASCTVKWWTSEALGFYQGLLSALAEAYDSAPEILGFFCALPSIDYPEVCIRHMRVGSDSTHANAKANREALIAAGFTKNTDQAALTQIVASHSVFAQTRSVFYLSPYEYMTNEADPTNSTVAFDNTYTVALAGQIRSLLGGRGVLSNAYLITPDAQTVQNAGLAALGAPLGWQTGTESDIGSAWEQVLDLNYGYGGAYVELIGETTTGGAASRPFFMQGPTANGIVQYPLNAGTDGYGGYSKGLKFWSARMLANPPTGRALKIGRAAPSPLIITEGGDFLITEGADSLIYETV